MSEFTIKQSEEKEGVVEDYLKVYTFFGRHDYEDDNGFPMLDLEEEPIEEIIKNPEVYAVEMCTSGNVRYFVKRGKYGHLFNPIGLYSEGTQHKQERHAGKPLWNLKRTHNKKLFGYYTQFLKTKNPAWLNNAEREV